MPRSEWLVDNPSITKIVKYVLAVIARERLKSNCGCLGCARDDSWCWLVSSVYS